MIGTQAGHEPAVLLATRPARAERCVVEDPVADPDQPTAQVHDCRGSTSLDDLCGDRSGAHQQHQGHQQDDRDDLLLGARDVMNDAVDDEPDQHEDDDRQRAVINVDFTTRPPASR